VLRAVMDEFDSDGDGYIQYDEFVDFVSGGGSGAKKNNTSKTTSGETTQQLSEAARNAVLQVVKALEQRQANGQYGDVTRDGSAGTIDVKNAELFAPLEEYDTHNKGRVTVNDFETGLIEMGVVGLTASAVRALLESFSIPKKKGFVDIAAFRRVAQRELILPGSISQNQQQQQSNRGGQA
jgi:Ca2+-binding EF-hand superfamily protein